jgi:hypothetical protein
VIDWGLVFKIVGYSAGGVLVAVAIAAWIVNRHFKSLTDDDQDGAE